MAAILLDKLGKVFNSTRALVCDRLILLAGGVKLDGGEAGDVIGDVVSCGIDFGNGDLGGEGCEQFTKLVVLWCETREERSEL